MIFGKNRAFLYPTKVLTDINNKRMRKLRTNCLFLTFAFLAQIVG